MAGGRTRRGKGLLAVVSLPPLLVAIAVAIVTPAASGQTRERVAASSQLVELVLDDRRVALSAAGRADVASGKVDERVLAVVEFLAEKQGEVTVGSLITGHRRFARPGVVSAHALGHAIDITALGGAPILGHQEPGGLAEQAIRELMALPSPLRPRQIISLLDLGGPSFDQEDHKNHIHIGY